MGGGNYDGDVGERSRSIRREVFNYGGYNAGDDSANQTPERRECHTDLNIKGKTRECRESTEHPVVTPIVAVMDVSRSRGDDAKVIYGKLPMFIGQIIMNNYVQHPEVCFMAIGDASSGDQAPIQVGQFESDNRLDADLEKMWLEEGGGGTGEESYELAAYVGAQLMKLDCNKRGEKGYFFFLGDEGMYPTVKRDQLKVWLGVDVPDDIPTKEVFRLLQKKFHVFFLYQKKAMESRKADIDAEMKARVEKAGGMYEDVDIRASLLWNNENDLDLHCMTPGGDHIYYDAYCKSSGRGSTRCGGYLDVDMNVRGESRKPVENIRWPKNKANPGRYIFWVENYGIHGNNAAATEFRAEIQLGQELFHIEGVTPEGKTGGASKIIIYDNEYLPGQANIVQDNYAAYQEEVIKEKWEAVLPKENILDLEDPKGVVDMMLGVLAVTGDNSVDLDGYIEHMAGRDQTDVRQAQTRQGLLGLSGELVNVDSSIGQLAIQTHKKKKKKKSQRI